jgi:hypothetical protein
MLMNYNAIHHVIFFIFQLERCPSTPVLCSIPREQNEAHFANWHVLHTGHLILYYFLPAKPDARSHTRARAHTHTHTHAHTRAR